jgi:RNA polymerase sigma factor (sigma-70 family)
MQTMTDAQLLEAYSSRQDDAAFGELMRRHGAMVYRACHRLLKDAHEAEDASQAVFVVLARKAGGLRKDDLAAWLYRVAHLVAAETVRKRMHRTGREDVYAVNSAIQLGEFAQDEIADPAVLGLVDTALLSLPERYRQAVILRYLQNHSEKDAARLVGCPLGTLSRRASQGIAMLRKRLGKLGVATSATALAGLLTSEASAAVPETLLPSILASVKVAVATTAAGTGAVSTAVMLAKGAMKAMFIAKVKMVAVVAAAVVIATGAAVPVGIAVAQAVGKNAKLSGAGVGGRMEASVVNLKLVSIVKEASGVTRVGFIDVGTVPNRNFMLRIGESFDGYTVVSADYENTIVAIEKDGVVTALKMEEQAISTNHVVARRFDPSVPQTSLSYEERIRQRRAEALAETSRNNQVLADLGVLNTALQEHFVMRGNYPDAKTWTNSAITNGLPKSFTFRDPWGLLYVYSNTTANSYTLFSTGAKREQERTADVVQAPR